MNEDTVEAVLLQAAGTRRPSSMDISPILALIEEGYDLDQDIVPVIRREAASSHNPISSWRWFVPAIKRETAKARSKASIGAEQTASNISGDFADGPRPVWWIRKGDPRYRSLALRWAKEKPGQRPPAPITSKYFLGEGWAFPAHWVE